MGRCFSRLAAKFAFFPPDPPTYRIKEEREGKVVVSGVPRERFMDVHLLNTKHGSKIVAFYLRNPYARLTLLYSHGNAADLGQLYDLFAQLKLNLRVNVMGYDYSGYGGSTGKPSERHTYADIEAVYECLETQYGISQENIILYGQSVGSGPTLHLAAKLPRLRGVVLHSAILSGLRVLCHADVSFCFDIFKNNKKIKKVKCPVLVIHGTDDDVVNLFHGKGLYKMAREPYEPLWIKGGGHCNLELYPDFISHLTRFIFEMERVNTATHLKKMRLAYLASPRTTPDKCCCTEITCECAQCFGSCTQKTCCEFNFDCLKCFNCRKSLKGFKCFNCFDCFKCFEGFKCSRCFKGSNCLKNVECSNPCFKCNHCFRCFESCNCNFKCFEGFKCFRCFEGFNCFKGFKRCRCFGCFRSCKCSDCL